MELVSYHDDVTSALRLFFSSTSPAFIERYFDKAASEAERDLTTRLDESDLRSSLMLLTALEAHFYSDFDQRCRYRLKDPLSRYFRLVERKRGGRVRLDEDILEGWKLHTNAPARLVSELRGAFKFRHWLAHGRYWQPKLGRNKYDFPGLFIMASAVISGFSFVL